MIEGAGKILTREIRETVEGFHNRIAPIYHVNDRGDAALFGSSVLLQIGADVFIATAKHVIDESTKSSLYLDGPTELEPLEGDFFACPERDVAVLKLNSDQVAILEKYRFLEEKYIATNDFISLAEYSVSVGYPASKTTRRHDKNELESQLFSYSNTSVEATNDIVQVPFRKRKNVDALTGAIVMAPKPHGMSGGPMFGVKIGERAIYGRPEPRLVGIIVEWEKHKQALLATPISIVLAVVRDAYSIALPQMLAQPLIKTHPVPYVTRKSQLAP